MTAPSTNQIGYQTFTKLAATSVPNNGNTFGTLTLSPVGSVWYVNANIYATSAQVMQGTQLTIQVGTTYTYNSAHQSIGGQYFTNANASTAVLMSVSGIYTVETGKQTICYGAWFYTSATTITMGQTCMTATRIA